MSPDSISEVTHESWFGRLGNAFKGILVGLILFVISFPLLFWNEGRALKQYKTLEEGSGTVVSVSAESVSPANEGRLIHVTGIADTGETLTDATFGISAQALKLKRVADMYQWEEKVQSQTKKQLGGGTETVKIYTYSKTWSERPVDSSMFKDPSGHQNPGAFPYETAVVTADKVTLGAFALSPPLVGKIDNFEALPLASDTPLPEPFKGSVTLADDGFYRGSNPAAPQVGDVRVRFMVANPAEVSVIARQTGHTFEPYATKAGGTIELLQMGNHSADAMIRQAQESNAMLAWILRLVGFLLMLGGLNLIFKPLSVFVDVLPILGTIVGVGTGFVSFLVSAILTLVTIAVAWIFYRPLLGIALIAVAVVIIMAIKGKFKKAQPAGSEGGGV